jgi:hypothetical protein
MKALGEQTLGGNNQDAARFRQLVRQVRSDLAGLGAIDAPPGKEPPRNFLSGGHVDIEV